ncbi:MAG TPA: hypothetical protein ENK12_02460 [Gammaproteobacteria bacterium]|nr:hypothetical protein [Gammaproteobacteria bacterium]
MYRQLIHLLLVFALAMPPLQAGVMPAAAAATPVPAMPCDPGMQGHGGPATPAAGPVHHDCCKENTDCCHTGDGCTHSAGDCGCKMAHAGASAPAFAAGTTRIDFVTTYDSIPPSIVATRAVCPLLRPPRSAA